MIGMSILERTSWTDKSIDLLIHDIIEYDMRDGGLSLIKEEKLLPQYMINQFDQMKKGLDRNAAIGKLRHSKVKEFAEVPAKQAELFKKYRLLFGEMNELSDEDILSIKKDAIFTKKFCYQLKLGEFVEFAEKHVYQAFMALEVQNPNGRKRLEFYWSEDGHIDVKGIEDKTLEKYHKDYTLKVLWKVMRYLVDFDTKGAINYLVKFMDDYKMLRLNTEYYRTFNEDSIFPVTFNGKQALWDQIGPDLLKSTDISYNYLQIYTNVLNLISS